MNSAMTLLGQHLRIDLPNALKALFTTLQVENNEAASGYLKRFYNTVILPLVRKNVLCFSESYGEFVQPPGLPEGR